MKSILKILGHRFLSIFNWILVLSSICLHGCVLDKRLPNYSRSRDYQIINTDNKTDEQIIYIKSKNALEYEERTHTVIRAIVENLNKQKKKNTAVLIQNNAYTGSNYPIAIATYAKKMILPIDKEWNVKVAKQILSLQLKPDTIDISVLTNSLSKENTVIFKPQFIDNKLQQGLDLYFKSQDVEAVKALEPFAKKGDCSAQILLGKTYFWSETIQDFNKAEEWLSKAGKCDTSWSNFELASFYHSEQIGKLDKALHFYNKASTTNNIRTLSLLASMELLKPSPNLDKVRQWSIYAAERGDALGFLNLSYFYMSQSKTEPGLKLIHVASELGSEFAKEQLKALGISVTLDKPSIEFSSSSINRYESYINEFKNLFNQLMSFKDDLEFKQIGFNKQYRQWLDRVKALSEIERSFPVAEKISFLEKSGLPSDIMVAHLHTLGLDFLNKANHQLRSSYFIDTQVPFYRNAFRQWDLRHTNSSTQPSSSNQSGLFASTTSPRSTDTLKGGDNVPADVAQSLKGYIKRLGYSCEEIDHTTVLLYEKGYSVWCKQNGRLAYHYEVYDRDGRWLVSVK